MWCVPFFKNVYTKLIKGYISHKGCPKNAKWLYFGAKIEIYGYDQNIWPPDKFCLCDAVYLGSLFSF